jgi:hypothetical protein
MTSVHVGTPPKGYQEWMTTKVHIHGFADLSAERGAFVNSPEFIALGNPWRLKLHPGGRNSSKTGWVSIKLVNRSNKSIDMNFGFSIKDGKGKQVVNMQTSTPIPFDPVGGPSSGRALPNFAERSTIIDSLVDGTLIVEVHMKPYEPSKSILPQFIPENPFCNNMIQIFNDEESADIVFAVGEHQSKNSTTKVAKIAPAIFHAHRVIITACSAILADLCQSKGDPTTPIEITDVCPGVFRYLLYYIYGGKIPDDDMKSHAKEIIDAADRYGVSTLKLEAEACLVEGTTFSLENVKELLLYAESKNCALLKEVAMDFLVSKKDEVIGNKMISFDDVPSTLMRDLFVAFAREPNRAGAAASGENEFNTLRISELRRMVHERGLDVDGSREMLIAALNKHVEEKSG